MVLGDILFLLQMKDSTKQIMLNLLGNIYVHIKLILETCI